MGALSLHKAPMPGIKVRRVAKKRGESEKGEGKMEGERSQEKRASRQEIRNERRIEKR